MLQVQVEARVLVLLGAITALLWLCQSRSCRRVAALCGGNVSAGVCRGVFFPCSLIVLLIIWGMVSSQDCAISQRLLVKIEVNTRLYKQRSALVYCPGITPALLRGSLSEGFEDCLLYLFV